MTAQKKFLIFSLIGGLLFGQAFPIFAQEASFSGQKNIDPEEREIDIQAILDLISEENLPLVESATESAQATESSTLNNPDLTTAELTPSAQLKDSPSFLNKKNKDKKPSLIKSNLKAGEKITIDLGDFQADEIKALIYDPSGKEIELDGDQTEEGQMTFVSPNAFRPGKYQLKIIDESSSEVLIEQDFTWGVLAINPNKSIYLPEEEAKLAMAVLDEQGKMVCDAKLVLKITNSSGETKELSTEQETIKVNPECQIHNYTEKPDYEASYQTGGVGAYQMELLAETQNGAFVINDSFEVREWVEFDIERMGPTRIYPPAVYTVGFNILANEDFEGVIEEVVPSSFEILPLEENEPEDEDITEMTLEELVQEFKEGDFLSLSNRSHSQIEEKGDAKIIRWFVNLKEGEEINLGYRFNAPNISPYFYLLGPLNFIDTNAQSVFQEIRQWQIAADDVVGPVYPGTVVSSVGWTDYTQANVSGDDGNVAYTTSTSSVSGITRNYDFSSIPDSATILGIVVEAEIYSNNASATAYLDVRLSKNAGSSWSNYDGEQSQRGTTSSVKTYGGLSELWGLSWTASEIKDTSNFYVDTAGRSSATNRNAQMDYVRVTVYYSPAITVSGTSDMTSGTVAMAVGNSLQADKTGTIQGDGTWSISSVTQPANNAIITVWVDGAAEADESTGVVKYSGSGDMTGMVLNRHVLSIGGLGNQSLNVTEVASYTNSNDEDVMHGLSGSTLNVDAGSSYTDEKINILANTTLTIGSSETLTTHHLTITGTLTSTTTAAYNVAGDWTNNGTFNQGSSTVTLNGSSAQSITGSTTTIFHNLTLTGSVTSSVTFNMGGTFNVNGGTFTPSGGTITMNNGSSISNSGTLTFQNISIAASATVTTSASFSIAGALTIGSSGSFSPSGGTITMATTGWTISNSGILVFSGLTISETPSSQPTASFSVSGALTVNSTKTLAPTSGTITMTGGSIVNNGGATTNLVFNNLTVTGTTTTSSDFTVNGTLNVNGGNLSPSGGIITMATVGWGISNSGTLVFKGLTISETPSSQPTSSFSIGATLTINSTKTLAPTSGTITMTTTSWAISNSGTLTFSGLTISETPSSQPTASFSVSGALTVNSTKTLAPTSGTITMTGGSISNSGTLTFNNLTVSGTTTTSSSFTINGTLNVSGNLSPSGGTITMATVNWGITNSGTLVFSSLTISETPSSQPTASFSVSGALTVNSTKTLAPTSGTITMTGGSISNSGTLTFNNLSVGSGASVSTSSNFSIIGNFNNEGTFTASAGTITFNGADSGTQQISGNSSFYNFNASTASNTTGRILQFAGNSTTAVSGTWTITGYSGKVITLQSSDTNNWMINPTATNVTYVDVYRSTNTGVNFCATYSTKDVNTIDWNVTDGSSCNQAPNNPSSLAQKKTDDTVLAVGDWTNETSVKLIASATDPDTSDTLYLCVEAQPLGTGFTNTETACGSGVAYSGTPVGVILTISSLADNSEYHWQARIKDEAGEYSSWISYGENLESERDFGTDTSAPTDGNVYDGTETGVDKSFNDGSLSQLSANWANFDAGVSGLDYYEYSIGTTIGGTDVKGWTDVGIGTSVTASGLTLQTSQMYFFNVRAVDKAGNVQNPVISSNGQLVSPNLTFSVSPSTLVFENLNTNNSFTNSQPTTLTTSTNAYGGYVIRAFVTDYLRSVGGTFTIPNFDGGSYATPGEWGEGNKGFGYTSSDTTIQGGNKFGGGTLYAPFSQTGPGDIVADHTTNVSGTPISNEEFTITNKVKTEMTQASSYYSTTVVYTITAQY